MKQQLMRNGFLFILLMGLTSAVFAQPTVTSTNPSKNQNNVSISGNVAITFSEAMNTSTLTASTIKVKGSISGSHAVQFPSATEMQQLRSTQLPILLLVNL